MNKKILIIEDEPDMRFLLKRFLISHNYAVMEAENLKEGYNLCAQDSPEIVILDVNLPDGSGINYAHEFKKQNRIVIFISADNDQLINNFKEYGADGFLKKPFGADELLTIINRAGRYQVGN